jgi:hypothetical protein
MSTILYMPKNVKLSSIDRTVKDLPTDEEFFTLKRIAEGKRKFLFKRYGFEEQVSALNNIVDMRTPEALKFIRQFFEEDVREHISSHFYQDGGGWERPIWAYDEHIFPNAGGQFGERLYYTVSFELLYGGRTGWGSERSLDSKKEVPHYRHHGKDVDWDNYVYKDKDEEAHEVMNSILRRIGE